MAVIAYQYRGDLVDQIHRGHIAVTDHTGKILWKLGDPECLTFARSSAKPLQAIPVAESGALEHYGITPQELAVICSSHNGEPFHVKAVESILHKAGLSPDQLCCGAEYPMYVPAEDALKIAGIPRAPIYCDCSGKHAGMLITARHFGESLENYTALEHPVQQRILSVFAEMCGVETSEVHLAVDGCGVPVHALPLYRLAQGYARMSLPTLFAPTRATVIRRITSAMTAHPEMVAGTDRICTQLMAAFGDRIFCKSGASAFYAVGIKDKGIGIALKMEDGASSIVPYAILCPAITTKTFTTTTMPLWAARSWPFNWSRSANGKDCTQKQSASVLLPESSINKATRLAGGFVYVGMVLRIKRFPDFRA